MVVTGGTSPYTYTWSNGVTTSDLSGLVAGSYSVTVTDANGCTSECTVVVSEPVALSAVCSSTAASCSGGEDGTATVVVTGGTSPYTYTWSNGVTTSDLSGLVAGSYSVTVTDANGCTSECTVVVSEPVALSAVCSSSTAASCSGGEDGTATVVVTGGTSPYTYTWSNGVTTSDLSGLVAGSYSVTVTDANGCTSECTVVVSEPVALSAVCSSTAASCSGGEDGTATVVVTGGTSPYTYTWSNGVTTSDLSGLVAGSYSVTVTDANGCTSECTVVVSEPVALSAVCLKYSCKLFRRRRRNSHSGCNRRHIAIHIYME